MSFLLKILLEFKRTIMKLVDGCGDFLYTVIDDYSTVFLGIKCINQRNFVVYMFDKLTTSRCSHNILTLARSF